MSAVFESASNVIVAERDEGDALRKAPPTFFFGNTEKRYSRVLFDNQNIFPDDSMAMKTPATQVRKVLALAKVDRVLMQPGIRVLKVTSQGKLKPRILTISKDRFTLFVTHQAINNKNKKKKKNNNNNNNNDDDDDDHGFVSTIAKRLPLPLLTRKGIVGFGNMRDEFVRYIDVADLDFVGRGFPGTHKMELSRSKNRLKGWDSRIDLQRDEIVTITHHGDRTLDVLVSDPNQRQALVSALLDLKQHYEEARLYVTNEARLLRYIWYDVDYNQDGLVGEKEFVGILHRINLYIKHPNQTFQDFCKQRGISKALSYQQCIDLLHHIQETELGDKNAFLVWDEVFGKDQTHVTAQDFLDKFIHNHQKDDKATLEDVMELFDRINKMEINRDESGEEGCFLNRYRFETYLHHPLNDAYDPDKASFHEDTLNRPISEYWINSSHNTYLTGDQLRSASSVEAYMSALRRGCKCLELDCWDGEKSSRTPGQPIPVVYHGGTLTSKILFQDIILCVKCYVEANPETYPIVLSLENHCSIPYQQEMARILRETLGSLLYAPFDVHKDEEGHDEEPALGHGDDLPTPQELRGMVLVKGKRPPEEDEEAPEDALQAAPSQESQESNKNHHAKKYKISKELAALTLLSGLKYKNFDDSIGLPSNHMHSIGETKIPRIAAKGSATTEKWRRYNERHMTRTYPSGARVDSSNYNPVVAWSTGCQLVALNFQTHDVPLLLNDGRFRQNGGCGYVPKPPSVLGHEPLLLPQPIRLRVRVLNGSCFPKPGGSKYGETIDPYVGVSVHDICKRDNREVFHCDTHYTMSITDNGFCPVWGETKFQEFEVYCPDVAMVQFSLMERDVGLDDEVADAVIPMNCLRRGFRSIQLHDKHGGRSGAFNFATFVVEIQY